ncbi:MULTISPECIES: fibronectin type III domain-containing protein [Sphingobacterium]|uniref:fibronectin type III domain-containing protein n=1 Tax=Sphingobacterium TaxID=28453 RepID=UPI0013DA5121|nr:MULTISPECIES: fibronectin type III domain-containing protein [unclassified Sphingobacterium]
MAKPVLSSKTETAAKLLQYAENILAKVTENASLFPDPVPTLADIESALQAYRSGLTEASFRDMRQVELKNQQAAQLKALLYDFSLYVETVAQGNPATIMAAGFAPSKKKVASGESSPKPTDFRVEITQAGLQQVGVRVKAWKPARFYQFEYRKVGSENEWTRVLTSKSKTIIGNLEHLQQYEFRVTYLGTNPTPNYSDIVRCYVV